MLNYFKRTTCVAMILLAIVGCASDKIYSYVQVFNSNIPYQQALAECEYQSHLQDRADNRANANDNTALIFAIFGQRNPTEVACMKRFGWELREFKNSSDAKESLNSKSAIVTSNNQNSQEAVQAQKIADAKAESEAFQRQARENCLKPEFKDYYAKTACFANDISFVQLADESFITSKEKEVLILQRQSVAEQMIVLKKLTTKYSGSLASKRLALIESHLETKQETNSLDLYNGKITWGQYNKIRKDIANDYKLKYSEIN